jgi:hypothetical protein
MSVGAVDLVVLARTGGARDAPKASPKPSEYLQNPLLYAA